MPESEVARMRREIDLSNEATERGLSGMACVASHAVITRKMEQIERVFQQQRQEIGEEQALEQFCLVMDALYEKFTAARQQQQRQEEQRQ